MILVTGGAGYIGSHTVRLLMDKGYDVVVLDNLVHGQKDFIERLNVPFIQGEAGDGNLISTILKGSHKECCSKEIEAVIHFAAYAYVGESVKDPAKYYKNNVTGSLSLLIEVCNESKRRNSAPIPIIFSSTCATYGIPESIDIPITEKCIQKPINPYGRSKYMIEQIIHDFSVAYSLPSVIFRYFNAAGAHPSGDLGEHHDPETHLIPLILDAALGRKENIEIFGCDYETKDGTCIRDYIHVQDLASAHIMGLELVKKKTGNYTFNLGTGTGYSVLQIIEEIEKVTGENIKVKYTNRRIGDPSVLIADCSKARNVMGWKPEMSDLKKIIDDAWKWHKIRFK